MERPIEASISVVTCVLLDDMKEREEHLRHLFRTTYGDVEELIIHAAGKKEDVRAYRSLLKELDTEGKVRYAFSYGLQPAPCFADKRLWQIARHSYLIECPGDIYPQTERWAAKLVYVLHQYPRLGMVFVRQHNTYWEEVAGDAERFPVCHNTYALSREALEDIGYWDWKHSPYACDDDIILSLRQRGYFPICVRNILVVHKHKPDERAERHGKKAFEEVPEKYGVPYNSPLQWRMFPQVQFPFLEDKSLWGGEPSR